jgi:hypothetical protein
MEQTGLLEQTIQQIIFFTLLLLLVPGLLDRLEALRASFGLVAKAEILFSGMIHLKFF